jgi:hypothetical protein
MQVRIKNTIDTFARLHRDGVPHEVIDDIAGKEVTLTENGSIKHQLNHKLGTWCIAPECYEIVQEKQ